MSESTSRVQVADRQAGSISIQHVSMHCGIPAVTLRAWERRYGLLTPARTDKGHRRYSEVDIACIEQIQHWLERGVPISQVAGLLADSAAANGAVWEQGAEQQGPWRGAVTDAICALESLNTRRLEQLLNGLLNDYSHALVLDHFCDPVRARLADTSALGGWLTLFDGVLQAKWSSRALSLAPRGGEAGWLLVPVGRALPALELAMVLNRPLWCLGAPLVTVELRSVLKSLAQRAGGVLWVVDRWPTAAQRQQIGIASGCGLSEACWGLDLSQMTLPQEVAQLGGRRQGLASELDRLQQSWSTP
ncbi:MAG: MerR family transcriptional regulator [Alcanivorax borkumensis]|jgi:DNA-binding transcriptional MerR regulator|uniref:Transcriptional regulator, MerR family n=1 Tax=Alcanivorax borkumensis (strain ATCC 700651 / DSM 11573 / NCIMB 13689 / SK2) TaxID=393595 RepID=Q0VRI5_ALCBS|nr:MULTISPECIES: MerR family transcriptional regulator [Alcanivorax]EUC69780.1 MerR family transcriptional regulator [Alcanivorax sp. 97CO-5]OJH08550.1 MAG: MerR family transcriptional regulator [Alcanivorax borkumensis]PKG01620.1 helix-turn-helix-type transcriptional regulator [Alcanivorax sp. 97CO-6]CAL16213.1 transcriptional regulator, MerR family [Alcanivorax borkumensis SK2]